MPTLSQLIEISDSAEPIPSYVTEDEKYLYAVLNFGGNPNNQGRIVKIDLTQSPPSLTALLTHSRLAMWQQVYLKEKNKLYAFGELDDENGTQRAGVAIADLSNDTAQIVYHPNTGDCNEFIGVAYDEKTKQFIVGERKGGGVTTGSNYPNGGGLWTIPLEDILNPSAWNRVHEFSPLPNESVNPSVFKIAIVGDQVFVILKGDSIARLVKASISDLTTWETIEDLDIATGIEKWGKRIAYVSKDPNTGNAVLKYSDDGGATWNTIDLGASPSTLSDLAMPVIMPILYGKYAIVVAQHSQGAKVLLVDIDGGSVSQIDTMTNPYCPHNVGTQRNDKVFIGNSASQSPGYIYQLSFDTRYVIAIALSKTNPAPGETITITATLKDANGNPVSDAEIEFYVITAKVDDRHYGDLIGTAKTDANGNASVQYTIPSTLKQGDVVVFRAVYKG